ncbi:zinc-alpha-2-glycoprotein-like [Nycticebus coucang]|uniref:zinc-alpha-2-glycoprotein-like n=1 Tax=Nycticebus coucang TaxID=9470 RepID=UPI00234D84D0|nr:zinc-alpha-2-glycoprotein-like [Nycticebus coucang]
MATIVPVLLLLLLLLCPAVPEKTQPCNYTLTYLYIGQSMPSEDSPRFQATGFLNDKEFLNYNSKDRKAKPQGPWKDVEEMEDWEKESQLQQAREAIFMDTLKDIMAFYNDSNGSHTFQGRFGCELQNNRSIGAFWKYAYDGKDFIEFNKEIPAWVPLDPAAWNTKKKWEAEEVYVHRAKAYLEKECPDLLRGYLNYSRHILDQQDPPSILVTSRETPEKTSILKCQAYDYYPEEINLYWTQAGEVQESESRGEVLPSGDGKYLSSIELSVLPQDEDIYFCSVEHSALAQPLSVSWDGRQEAGAESAVGAHPQ